MVGLTGNRFECCWLWWAPRIRTFYDGYVFFTQGVRGEEGQHYLEREENLYCYTFLLFVIFHFQFYSAAVSSLCGHELHFQWRIGESLGKLQLWNTQNTTNSSAPSLASSLSLSFSSWGIQKPSLLLLMKILWKGNKGKKRTNIERSTNTIPHRERGVRMQAIQTQKQTQT